MSEVQRLTELPTPRWKVGDTVFTIETREGQENTTCPDCLGTKVWAVKSPGGFETTVGCPRCSGSGKLGLRSRMPLVRQLTVGSIRVSTVAYDPGEHIEYMCDETGVGSGSIWREGYLRGTREEATAAAEMKAAAERADLDKGLPGEERRQIRYLNKYQMMPAAVKEAEKQVWSANYDLRALVDKIAELEPDSFLSSYGFDGENEGGYATLSLDARTVRVLQEHLCSFSNPRIIEMLREARAKREEKCKC